MRPMELFRRAVAEIGYASPAELSAHLEKKHGVKNRASIYPTLQGNSARFGKDEQTSPRRKTHPHGTTITGCLNQSNGTLGRSRQPFPHRIQKAQKLSPVLLADHGLREQSSRYNPNLENRLKLRSLVFDLLIRCWAGKRNAVGKLNNRGNIFYQSQQ